MIKRWATGGGGGGGRHKTSGVFQNSPCREKLYYEQISFSTQSRLGKVVLISVCNNELELEGSPCGAECLFFFLSLSFCFSLSLSLSLCCSVELDFKQQEDKLQPLMKRLCPTEDAHLSSLPYPQEAFTSTPKRKSKADSKKHSRWKMWFLWEDVEPSPLWCPGFMCYSYVPFLGSQTESSWLFFFFFKDLVTNGDGELSSALWILAPGTGRWQDLCWRTSPRSHGKLEILSRVPKRIGNVILN